MDVQVERLDVITYSWQKVLGGEGAHGMIALGPRAVERLESYRPNWPIPKHFQMTKGGKLIEGIFRGDTINTPSMLCVEDALDGLLWAESQGGRDGLIQRTRRNSEVIEAWVERTPWVDFLAAREEIRSPTSICLKIVDPAVTARTPVDQGRLLNRMTDLLAAEKAAFDIASYRDAPPGLRVWAGGTVETSDLEALTPWLDWAFEESRNG
jgi:phosphoserine aminotransferase